VRAGRTESIPPFAKSHSEGFREQAKTTKVLKVGRTESSFPWLSFVFLLFLIREIRGIRGSQSLLRLSA
jgi:hypothetical protein